MKKVEAEIEETAGNWPPVNEHMFLEQVPAARARHEHRQLLI
jgi:hypothetical protein